MDGPGSDAPPGLNKGQNLSAEVSYRGVGCSDSLSPPSMDVLFLDIGKYLLVPESLLITVPGLQNQILKDVCHSAVQLNR